MEFTVKQSDLVRELALGQGAVERKTTIPILANVRLEAAPGRVTLTSTDLELAFNSACPAEVKKGGTVTLPARRLLDCVKLLPDAEIKFKVSDKDRASIVCGSSKTQLAGIGSDSFPELPTRPDDAPINISTAALAEMCAKTAFAVLQEESRFTLNAAQLVFSKKSITMTATDGHRLAQVTASGDIMVGPTSILVPHKALIELQKMAKDTGPGTTEFWHDENHLFFQMGGRLLIARKITGTFPDIDRVINGSFPQTVSPNRLELKAAVLRVAEFSDERSHGIRLNIGAQCLEAKSSISEIGQSEDQVAVDYTGTPVEIGFNALFILDFLNALPDDEKLFISFKDAGSAALFQPATSPAATKAAGVAYKYVLMPMRT